MAKEKREARRFFISFVYAFSGIKQAFRKERNLHIQSVCGIAVLVLSFILRISQQDWILVMMVIGGVISLELVNTAIERVVDLVTEDRHPLAKAAKDIAAGAVLFFSTIAVIVSLLIFIKYIV